MPRLTVLYFAVLLFFCTACADLNPRLINDRTVFSPDPPITVSTDLPFAGNLSKSIYQEFFGGDVGVGGLIRIRKFFFGQEGQDGQLPERMLAVLFIETDKGIWHPRLLELGGRPEDFGFLEVDGMPFQYVANQPVQGYAQLTLGKIEQKGAYDPFRGTNGTSIFLAIYLVEDRLLETLAGDAKDRIFSDLAEHVRIAQSGSLPEAAATQLPNSPSSLGELGEFSDRFSDEVVLSLAKLGFRAVPKLEIPQL